MPMVVVSRLRVLESGVEADRGMQNIADLFCHPNKAGHAVRTISQGSEKNCVRKDTRGRENRDSGGSRRY